MKMVELRSCLCNYCRKSIDETVRYEMKVNKIYVSGERIPAQEFDFCKTCYVKYCGYLKQEAKIKSKLNLDLVD